MSLEYQLGETLTRIRTLVEDWLARYQEDLPHHVTDEPGANPTPLLDEAAAQYTGHNPDEITSALDALIQRFESFYKYDTSAFDFSANRLYGYNLELLESGEIADPGPSSGSVCGLLRRAEDEEMDQIDGLLGLVGIVDADEGGEYTEDIWSGDGAKAFFNGFVLPFHRASLRHQAQAGVLAIVARLYHRTVEAIQTDIKAIADSALGRMEYTIGDGGPQGSTGQAIANALTFLSLLIPDPEDLLTIGAIIAAPTDEDKVVLPSRLDKQAGTDAPQDLAVEGSLIEEIINSAWEKIDLLQEIIDDGDRRIRSALSTRFGYSPHSGTFANGGLAVPRPDLADGADTFGEVEVASPAANFQLVAASVAGIYQAGYEILPSAANHYQRAAELLDLPIEDGADQCFPWSLPVFQGAVDNLARAVRDARDSMSASGETLVTIATDYCFTDERSRNEFQELISDVSEPRGGLVEQLQNRGLIPTPHTAP